MADDTPSPPSLGIPDSRPETPTLPEPVEPPRVGRPLANPTVPNSNYGDQFTPRPTPPATVSPSLTSATYYTIKPGPNNPCPGTGTSIFGFTNTRQEFIPYEAYGDYYDAYGGSPATWEDPDTGVVYIPGQTSGYKGLLYKYTGQMADSSPTIAGPSTDLVSPHGTDPKIAPPGFPVYSQEGQKRTDTGVRVYVYAVPKEMQGVRWTTGGDANPDLGPAGISTYLIYSGFTFNEADLAKVKGKKLTFIRVAIRDNAGPVSHPFLAIGVIFPGELLFPYGPIYPQDLGTTGLRLLDDTGRQGFVATTEAELGVLLGKRDKEYSSWALAHNRQLLRDRNVLPGVSEPRNDAASLPGDNVGRYYVRHLSVPFPEGADPTLAQLFIQVGGLPNTYSGHSIDRVALELVYCDAPEGVTLSPTPIVTANHVGGDGGLAVAIGEPPTPTPTPTPTPNTVTGVSVTPNGNQAPVGQGTVVNPGKPPSGVVNVGSGVWGLGSGFGYPNIFQAFAAPTFPSCMGRPHVSLISVWGAAVIGRCSNWEDLPLEAPSNGDCGCGR
jgi:hypothetical protein